MNNLAAACCVNTGIQTSQGCIPAKAFTRIGGIASGQAVALQKWNHYTEQGHPKVALFSVNLRCGWSVFCCLVLTFML